MKYIGTKSTYTRSTCVGGFGAMKHLKMYLQSF